MYKANSVHKAYVCKATLNLKFLGQQLTNDRSPDSRLNYYCTCTYNSKEFTSCKEVLKKRLCKQVRRIDPSPAF